MFGKLKCRNSTIFFLGINIAKVEAKLLIIFKIKFKIKALSQLQEIFPSYSKASSEIVMISITSQQIIRSYL